ncbi:MAG: DedA family protein [Deltaproteobacteria bacterium]|nr:DedA family protein [Deltaproteobacteria bacterium]
MLSSQNKNNQKKTPAEWVFYLLLLVLMIGLGVAVWWVLQQNWLVKVAEINRWLADHFIAQWGYVGVFVLMTIESTFLPIPSEIIIPPAADLARRSPDWRLDMVIAMGVLGSVAGALINYTLARWLGRSATLALIHRWGGYVHVREENYLRGERLFQRHEIMATLTGRLLPGVRHLISLPAGLARMNLASFCLFTALGSGLWVGTLAWLGYSFGQDPETLAMQMKASSQWLALGTALVVGAYLAWNHTLRKKAPSP